MSHPIDRREFLKLAGLGGVVFASSLGAARAAGTMAAAKGGTYDDFYFVQLSDTHWGFQGPPNPDAKGTLKKAVAAVNSMSQQPDFIVFTGDLTHTTDDPKERRQRLELIVTDVPIEIREDVFDENLAAKLLAEEAHVAADDGTEIEQHG